MEFQEYFPKNSWASRRRRAEFIDGVKAHLCVLGLLAAYCIVGIIEIGM